MTRQDALTLRAIDRPIDGHPNPQAGRASSSTPRRARSGRGCPSPRGSAAAAKMDEHRPQHLLPHRRRRIARGADLGGDGFHRRSRADQLSCRSSTATSWRRATGSARSRAPRGWRRRPRRSGSSSASSTATTREQIRQALNELHVVKNGNRPLAIVARTVKGWGAPAEQGMGKHGTPVKKDKMAEGVRRAGSRPPRTWASRTTRSNGELKISRHRQGAGSSAEREADQDRSFRRRPGDGGARQGLEGGQTDRAAQGVRRGAASRWRGGQARSSASMPT